MKLGDTMIEYDKAKTMLAKWTQYDISDGFSKGMPNYPTNTAFVKAINEELQKDLDRIVINILDAKQSRINGRAVLVTVIERYIQGTEYIAEEVLSIMLDE